MNDVIRHPEERAQRASKGDGPAVAAHPSRAASRPPQDDGSRELDPITLEANVYDRTALAPGFAGQGPALIEEYGSTTLIWPGDRFTVGDLGELRISIDAK